MSYFSHAVDFVANRALERLNNKNDTDDDWSEPEDEVEDEVGERADEDGEEDEGTAHNNLPQFLHPLITYEAAICGRSKRNNLAMLPHNWRLWMNSASEIQRRVRRAGTAESDDPAYDTEEEEERKSEEDDTKPRPLPYYFLHERYLMFAPGALYEEGREFNQVQADFWNDYNRGLKETLDIQ